MFPVWRPLHVCCCLWLKIQSLKSGWNVDQGPAQSQTLWVAQDVAIASPFFSIPGKQECQLWITGGKMNDRKSGLRCRGFIYWFRYSYPASPAPKWGANVTCHTFCSSPYLKWHWWQLVACDYHNTQFGPQWMIFWANRQVNAVVSLLC